MDLISKEQTLLNRDSSNAGLNPLDSQKLSQTAKQLDDVKSWPVTIRFMMANFYLGGGVDAKGAPNMDAVAGPNGPEKAHTQVLKPDRAKMVLQEAADIEKSQGKDVIQNPALDPLFTGLWQLTEINAPESLRKAMDKQTETAHSLWSRAAATVAGVVTTALIARYAGLQSASDFVSLGGLAAIGGGFATATATDYGMEKLVFGDKDFTFTNALVQGGGTYLVAEGALLARRAILDAHAGSITSDVAGQNFLQQLPEDQRNLQGMAQAFDARKLPRPAALVSALKTAQASPGAATAALSSEQAGLALGVEGYNAAALLRTVFPDAQAAAAVTAGATDAATTATNSTDVLSQAASGLDLNGATLEDANSVRTAATAGGEAAASSGESVPAANGATQPGWLKRTLQGGWQMARSPYDGAKALITDANNPETVLSPFKSLATSHIPTANEIRLTRLYAAAGMASTYQVGKDLESGAIGWQLGAKNPDGSAITPWGVLGSKVADGSLLKDTALDTGLYYLWFVRPNTGLQTPGTIAKIGNMTVGRFIPDSAVPTIKVISGAAGYPLFGGLASQDMAGASQHTQQADKFQSLIDLQQGPVQNVPQNK
jgi:hypothetical protein